MLLPAVLFTLLSFAPLPSALASEQCYDLLCASVVSKCMLTQACKCEINRKTSECSCCHNCTQCLGADYQRCCSCLGLCEPSSDLSLVRESQVGDIAEPFHELFKAFTSAPDEKMRWTHVTFPIDATLEELGRKADLGRITYEVVPDNQLTPPSGAREQVNCTVMYLSQCVSVTKCHDYCSRHGAAYYRGVWSLTPRLRERCNPQSPAGLPWYFFDGCCECVGQTCLNYGLNESRCSQCPAPDENDLDVTEYNNDMDEEPTK